MRDACIELVSLTLAPPKRPTRATHRQGPGLDSKGLARTQSDQTSRTLAQESTKVPSTLAVLVEAVGVVAVAQVAVLEVGTVALTRT
jgi:hypothetical protein